MIVVENVKILESVSELFADPKHSETFYSEQSEKDCDFINYPERSDRCFSAAENGSDGKLHCEHLDDIREYVSRYFPDAQRDIEAKLWKEDLTDYEYDRRMAIVQTSFGSAYDKFIESIEAIEKYHIDNGTYENEVG
jgi:hypothetical protein